MDTNIALTKNRSAEGLSTKIHAICDALGNPVAFHLTEGQAHDLEGVDVFMNHLVKVNTVLSDKAYDADERVRQNLEKNGCTIVISPQKNRLNPAVYDKNLYKSRHLIENFFAKLKQYRAIATRYDKTSANVLGAIHLASILICLN